MSACNIDPRVINQHSRVHAWCCMHGAIGMRDQTIKLNLLLVFLLLSQLTILRVSINMQCAHTASER